MVKKVLTGIHALTVSALVLAGACGGGSNPPIGPSDSGGGGGGGQSGATITIGANGAISPAQVTIDRGQTVTFVNNSNRTHNIQSDPHPVHTDCTAMNAVNLLGAAQTKQTGAFTTARTCGFHDHDDPDNAALKGSIVVR
jgi:plastocyanin